MACCLFWPLSFFSKETGALFPCFALAWELIIFKNVQGQLDRFARLFVALFSLGATACVLYLLLPTGQWIFAGYGMRSFSLTERLLTEGRVLWFYLGLILFPRLDAFGVYHDDFTISNGLFFPWTTLPAWLGLLGLCLLAWRTRKKAPIVTFGIVWFFIGHALESTILPLEIAHEHRNYIPLIGVLLPFAWLGLRCCEKNGIVMTICVTLAISFLGYCTLITALRADQFGDDVKRTQIEAMHHRQSSSAQFEAGRILANLADARSPASPIYSFARSHFEQAAELNRNAKMPWLALVNLNCVAGLPIESAWIRALNKRLEHRPFSPADQTVLYGLKEMAIKNPACLKPSEVESLFASSLNNPTTAIRAKALIHSWHADYLWLGQHDLEAAKSALRKSLALIPGNPSNRLKWAQLVYLSGDKKQATRLLLELRNAALSAEERDTRRKLLSSLGVAER